MVVTTTGAVLIKMMISTRENSNYDYSNNGHDDNDNNNDMNNDKDVGDNDDRYSNGNRWLW